VALQLCVSRSHSAFTSLACCPNWPTGASKQQQRRGQQQRQRQQAQAQQQEQEQEQQQEVAPRAAAQQVQQDVRQPSPALPQER